MKWLFLSQGPSRPVVLVEDHARHIEEILGKIARGSRPEALSRLTVVYVAKDGNDTALASVRWLLKYPALQIVTHGDAARARAERADTAILRGGEPPDGLADLIARARDASPRVSVSKRLLPLPAEALADPNAYRELLKGLIRPNGLLVTDVQLEAVSFNPDDPFATLKVASRACSEIASPYPAGKARAVALWVMSNRPFFEPSVDEQLRSLGINHELITSKQHGKADWLGSEIAERLGRYPWMLLATDPAVEQTNSSGRINHETLALRGGWVGPDDKDLVNDAFDVVLWPEENGVLSVGGRAILSGTTVNSERRITLWRELVEDRLEAHEGISAEEVLELIDEGGQTAAHLVGAIRKCFNRSAAHEHVPSAHDGRYFLGVKTRVALVVAEQDKRALRYLRSA